MIVEINNKQRNIETPRFNYQCRRYVNNINHLEMNFNPKSQKIKKVIFFNAEVTI